MVELPERVAYICRSGHGASSIVSLATYRRAREIFRDHGRY